MNASRERQTYDPRFRLLLLVNSKLTPGKKAWKLVLVPEKPNTEATAKTR
jgi:hypothetical protein